MKDRNAEQQLYYDSKDVLFTANGGVLILAVLHYSYSTPKSCTNDNNLDEQLIFIRITAIVSTMQNNIFATTEKMYSDFEYSYSTATVPCKKTRHFGSFPYKMVILKWG